MYAREINYAANRYSAEWCFTDVSTGLGSSFYDKYYYSYKQMMAIFDTVMKDVQSLPIVRVRIMISLVFWGFPKEDLLDLTCADLSFTDRTVYSKTLRKPIVVPLDVINLCIAAANTKDYIDMTGRKIQVADTDAVIKLQTKSNIKDVTVQALITNTYKTFRNVWLEQVQRLTPDLKEYYATKTFNLNDVETSGLLYRVYLQEQACGYSYSTIGEFTKAADLKTGTTAYMLFRLYRQWKEVYDL